MLLIKFFYKGGEAVHKGDLRTGSGTRRFEVSGPLALDSGPPLESGPSAGLRDSGLSWKL